MQDSSHGIGNSIRARCYVVANSARPSMAVDNGQKYPAITSRQKILSLCIRPGGNCVHNAAHPQQGACFSNQSHGGRDAHHDAIHKVRRRGRLPRFLPSRWGRVECSAHSTRHGVAAEHRAPRRAVVRINSCASPVMPFILLKTCRASTMKLQDRRQS